jgi:hypothetical protein
MRTILIGGAQRSGTTLVQTLIANALPSAPLLPEAHIVHDLLRSWQRAKTQWTKTSRFYATHADAIRYFRTATTTHLNDIAERYPAAKYLVLKDPHFVDTLPEIAELLPAATQIMCVRDPRDIVASFIRIGERQSGLQQKTRYRRREVNFICKKVNASYRPFVEQDSPPGIVLVRYEDAAANPAAALERLAKETGLPLNPARSSDPVWLEDEYRHQETWRTELEGGPPTPENVGGFRHVLSREEIIQVERVCRPLVERFAYFDSSGGRIGPSLYDHARDFLHRVRTKLTE